MYIFLDDLLSAKYLSTVKFIRLKDGTYRVIINEDYISEYYAYRDNNKWIIYRKV